MIHIGVTPQPKPKSSNRRPENNDSGESIVVGSCFGFPDRYTFFRHLLFWGERTDQRVARLR